ncbi:MAG: C40 family peptidase [Treponema sp.]|nr:C40 family peptidase [Treponema sp.]
MKHFTIISLIFLAAGFCAARLYAAPLEGGYSLAPGTTVSPEEKARAYQTARIKVIEASRKYEGVPYRYGGMTINGLDCSGFIGISFKDALGVVLPRSASALYTWVERIPLEKAQPGDFLFFKTDNTGNITHVVLYLGERRFIHSASAGSKTGVIYSSLSEDYWTKTYAGAGRAFPEAASNFKVDSSLSQSGSGGSNVRINAERPVIGSSAASSSGMFLVGAAFTPIWNSFDKEADLIRGLSSQFFLGIDISLFDSRMILSAALRPEYDWAFGVFSLPVTLSWGPNEKFSIFAGPVFNFGAGYISASWFGIAGVSAAPFIIKTASGEFAPYIEAVWQSYHSGSNNSDFFSGFIAGFRLSTGIRWMYRL